MSVTHPQGFLEVDLQLCHSHMRSSSQRHGKMFALQLNATKFHIVGRFCVRQGRRAHSKLEMYTLGRQGYRLPGRGGNSSC